MMHHLQHPMSGIIILMGDSFDILTLQTKYIFSPVTATKFIDCNNLIPCNFLKAVLSIRPFFLKNRKQKTENLDIVDLGINNNGNKRFWSISGHFNRYFGQNREKSLLVNKKSEKCNLLILVCESAKIRRKSCFGH
jgi:hypothetical protein